jgi:hypothetical protein
LAINVVTVVVPDSWAHASVTLSSIIETAKAENGELDWYQRALFAYLSRLSAEYDYKSLLP